MLDLDAVFDRDPARRMPYRRLGNEAIGVLTRRPRAPDPATLPRGQGRAVLVIPAFLTGDAITRDLRRFLASCGFTPYGWGLGINLGPTRRILHGLARRFDQVQRRHGSVGLVGISLGGLLARNLGYERPGGVSHIVTVASPFRLPTASTIRPLFALTAPHYSPEIDLARLSTPLPVPSTMIYTRDDGIVAPHSCWTEAEDGAVVALDGPHLFLASHPEAMRATVRGLARGG
jgi:pimeloyl-ACP methyl ester carboxylesterase